MLPHIPQDIWDEVILSIDPDDYRTLANCALVQRDWVPICRFRLSRHGHINIRGLDEYYERVVDRFLRPEGMTPWLHGVKSLSFDADFDVGQDRRGYRFFHDFAGRLPNLRSLTIGCVDWTAVPHHPSTYLMFSTFSSVTYLKLYQTSFPSFTVFRRTLTSLPSLTTLVLYNHTDHWFPLPREELWNRSSLMSRPALRVFDICFENTYEELDVLFHWLLQTPSRTSIRDLAFSTVRNSSSNTHESRHLRIGSLDFISALALSVSTLRIDCDGKSSASLHEACTILIVACLLLLGGIPLSLFRNLHTLVINMIQGGWEQLASMLRNFPSRLRCIRRGSLHHHRSRLRRSFRRLRIRLDA